MNESQELKQKDYISWLLSPWAIFSGIFTGVLIGLYLKPLAKALLPIGEIYLSLLEMCLIPILITAIISSIGRMIREGKAGNLINRIIAIFSVSLIIASLTGIFTAVIFKPGSSLNERSKATLGKLISTHEMNSQNISSENQSPQIMDFINNMVPKNIFTAITKGQNLSILFFCILLGLSLGLVPSATSDLALSVIEALYDACQKLISWIMYGLPFGLLSLFAAQISQAGLDALTALIKFVLLCYLSAIILMVIYNMLISITNKKSFFQNLYALKETLVIALGTSSSFAAIPSAMQCLQKNFKIKRNITNFAIPMGINLNPQGSVLHFAFSTIFIAQVYQINLGTQGYVITLIGSILAGMAATGVPGAGSLSMIALVLGPLGLPSQAAIILLLAVDPIIDPILTVATMHSNCAATILAANKSNQTKDTVNS